MEQDFALLLKPLTPNTVGENLHYDPVYDHIREARRSDNPKLSRGIWEFQLKQSDWGEVEKLCTDALIHRSKDFQIAAWLAESWGMMGSIEGLARGFDFLEQFIGAFGQTMYPIVDGDDQEHRLRICDWMDEAFSRVMIMIPLTQSDVEMNFADFMAATRLDTIARRSNDPDKVLSNAAAAKDVTLADFNAQMSATDIDFIVSFKACLDLFRKNFEKFRVAIDLCTKGQSPSFKTIGARSQEMSHLFDKIIAERPQRPVEVPQEAEEVPQVSEEKIQEGVAPEPIQVAAPAPAPAPLPPPAPARSFQTLEDLYDQLDLLANAFAKQDPHGPVSSFLRRLVSWEGKTVPDILQEYSHTPEQMAALVKLMSRD